MQQFSPNLIAGFNDGNDKAVTIMYESYFRRVLYKVQAFTGGSPDDEDLARGIMSRFVERRPRFETIKNLEKYLDRVTMGVCEDDKRRKRSRKLNAHRVQEQLNSTLIQNMENEKKRRICAYLMKVAADNLPANTRQVFQLSFIEEMSSRQIAERMNLSPRTVDYHRNDAYKRLKLQIQKRHSDPGEILLSVILLPLLIAYFFLKSCCYDII